jgi:hypothetical protein
MKADEADEAEADKAGEGNLANVGGASCDYILSLCIVQQKMCP